MQLCALRWSWVHTNLEVLGTVAWLQKEKKRWWANRKLRIDSLYAYTFISERRTITTLIVDDSNYLEEKVYTQVVQRGSSPTCNGLQHTFPRENETCIYLYLLYSKIKVKTCPQLRIHYRGSRIFWHARVDRWGQREQGLRASTTTCLLIKGILLKALL